MDQSLSPDERTSSIDIGYENRPGSCAVRFLPCGQIQTHRPCENRDPRSRAHVLMLTNVTSLVLPAIESTLQRTLLTAKTKLNSQIQPLKNPFPSQKQSVPHPYNRSRDPQPRSTIPVSIYQRTSFFPKRDQNNNKPSKPPEPHLPPPQTNFTKRNLTPPPLLSLISTPISKKEEEEEEAKERVIT